MNPANKKIKLDPDTVKIESQQNQEPDEEDDIFEEMLDEPCDENIEVEAACYPLKYDIEQEPVDATEYMVEINADLQEMIHDSTPQQTEDETKNEDSTEKSDKNAIRDFICTTCNFNTSDPLGFTNHWLSHETLAYTNENGVYVCQISDCFHVAGNIKNILVHIASQHLFRYRCAFCYYVTYSNEDFDEHSKKHYTYQCVKCDLQSSKHFFVQNHLATPLECGLCDFKADHWILYQKHINMHRYPSDSIIDCGYCGFTTGDENLLEKHLIVHFERSISCKMCHFNGINIEDLDNHYKNSHHTTLQAVRKMHKCKFCTCKFINLGTKEMHEKLHSKQKTTFKCCTNSTTIQCPYCNHQDKIMDDHILLKHSAELELEGLRFENNDDETVVKVLNLDFFKTEDESEVEQENDTAEQEDVITISDDDSDDKGIEDPVEIYADKACHGCPKCARIFKGMHAFDRHLKTVHNMTYADVTKKFKVKLLCEFCGFRTFDVLSLKTHFTSQHLEVNKTEPKTELKLISDDQRQVCPFCYYVTFTEDEFEAHCQTHTIFKCTECNFESTKRLFVEDHMDNPWACLKCEFKANHWLLLKNHKLKFHNKARFRRCRECYFETRKPELLKIHRLTHSWAFLRCKMCTYKTGSENALKTHYKRSHNCTEPGSTMYERPYQCDFCDCTFRRETFLDRHRALHGANGPFNDKCSQCHTSNRAMSKDDSGKDTNSEADIEPDSWAKCPYCGYKDDARYRMIDHLSQTHEIELEIEGFRCGETPNKLYEETANTEKPGKNTTMESTNTVRDTLACTSTQKQKNKNYEKSGINTEVDETTKEPLQCTLAQREMQNTDFEKPGRSTKVDESNRNAPVIDDDEVMIKKKIIKTENIALEEDVTHAEVRAIEGSEDTDSINRPNEESDDIARANMLQEGANNIQQPIEEFEDDVHVKVLQESEHIGYADPFKEEEETADNILQPIEEVKVKEEMIESEEISRAGVLEEEDVDSIEEVEIKIEATDFLEIETADDATTVDAACSSSRNLPQTEQKTRQEEKGPIYYEHDQRWYCPLCPYSGTSNYYALQHYEEKHKGLQNPTFRCRICRYDTRSWRAFSDHINMMHRTKAGSEGIPCKQPDCNYKAPSVDELSRHMARHLQTSIKEMMNYKCERCNFATVSDTVFKKHNCISTTYYECYDCGFKCETKMRMYHHIVKRHRYTYSKIRGFQCRKCGRASKDTTWMDRHLAICTKMW
ncbi:unnamed protein product [Acanthoscelides obtectus]|uniref:C2H2-type domain-containing protein n=1 Tax=Acanthoscelides obtectus TaxID=200917 RepID=A0A9P0PVS1_ACAOB|nr:unnamed protein product [Acanthoscelides obtectus]CAK1626577.1 Zinc finger protein 142 [Acanthoscelides obtectus]